MKNLIFIDTVIKMPLIDLPVRTVAVQNGQNLILISPGSKITDQQYQELTTQDGERLKVTDIVAPSTLHTGGVPKAASRFTEAHLWCPVGKKHIKADQIKWTHELTAAAWPYDHILSIHPIQGIPKIQEVVFFHKPSKSLIVTDLFFNIIDPKGFGAWVILNLFGTYKKFALSKFFMKYITDKNLFKQSLEDLLKLDFENVIVSHGQTISEQARQKVQAAIEPALK